MARGWVKAVLLGALGFCLAGCAGDPKDLGLTGPFPNGVRAVTLTHPAARTDVAADAPGVNTEALDRYAPSMRIGTGSPGTSAPGKRYYGYDY
jgi:hypothetical protein